METALCRAEEFHGSGPSMAEHGVWPMVEDDVGDAPTW